jgi:AcrR family transcriptional regulator
MDLRPFLQADNPSLKFIELVESAHKLFWRYGIRRVTVEEICRTADVSKMTFYNHFKNKVDLALYVLRKVMQAGLQSYREIMDREVSFAEKAADFIQMKLDASDEVSREILEELYVSPIPEIAEYLRQQQHRNVQILLADLTAAQERGEIRRDIKPEFLLYFMNRMIEMASDERVVSLYESPRSISEEILNLFFYGILPHPRKDKS